jgi:hypothetical protein
MATTATKTDLPDLSQKVREQLLSTVQQGQALTLDAAQTWVKALSVISIPDLPAVPGIPNVPDVAAVTTYTFDVATDLLNAQRDFAVKLAAVIAPVTAS